MRLKALLLSAVLAVVILLALPFSAGASLGGDLTTVHDDQAKMQGTLRTTSTDSYDVHEIHGPGGIVLREFASASTGLVFGVAWQGRSHPDLRQVLGSYYAGYVQGVHALRAQRHGHGPLFIQQGGLVVRTGGHMGALTGKAYLPQNMPAGVQAEEIR
jgi:hypothetical protein